MLTDRRVLGDTDTSGPLVIGTAVLAVLAIVAALWPAVVAWPLAAAGRLVRAQPGDPRLAQRGARGERRGEDDDA